MDTQALAQRFNDILSDLNIECAGVQWLPANGRGTLRVYIEAADHEVDIDDCEAASRELSASLDVDDPISVPYALEVSSPGLDRPLFTLGQFERFVGEKIKLVLSMPQDGQRRFQGQLAGVDGSIIRLLKNDGVEVGLEYTAIDSANLVPDWVALGLAPNPKKEQGSKRRNKRKNSKKRK